MVVTAVELITKNKYKVYLDEQFAFVLYKGELSRYKVKIGNELISDHYEIIMKDVVVKRAKKRVLYLLQQMARTEKQIREKLLQNFYPEEVVEVAVEYAKDFGYIDDENYAMNYIRFNKEKKSKKDLCYTLKGKGIDSAVLERCICELYHNEDERSAIENCIRKKGYNKTDMSEEKKQKLYGYLARKGFSYENIRQVIQVYEAHA